MKRALIILALLGLYLTSIQPAHATSYLVNLGGLSLHDGGGKHNATNPGLGLEVRTSDQWAFIGGYYANSYWRPSRYLGAIYTPWSTSTRLGALHFGGMAGGADGYQTNPRRINPAAALVAELRRADTAFQLNYVPRIERLKNTGTLFLIFKARFK